MNKTIVNKILVVVVLIAMMPMMVAAQPLLLGQDVSKLSSSLQHYVGCPVKARANKISSSGKADARPHVCAFVRVAGADASPLAANGCKVLARIGDIFIADVPTGSLHSMIADSRILRIEAERGNDIALDSISYFTNMAPVASGAMLPQAYTGRGVVMGVQDVGFDLTHPTFRDTQGKECRISRFWDQLSADTVGSSMYVGAEYVGAEAVLHYAHSRDAMKIWHGTHTLGIAAGNGAGTIYKGMAPESEICLVNNAVNSDREFIADADLPKYTYATDVLGFKYIFDYAQSVGKPCVVSFSEGSPDDLSGDTQLFREALAALVGPGRILVSSAGNNGILLNHVHKSADRPSAGTFIIDANGVACVVAKSRAQFQLRTTIYNVEKCLSASPRLTIADGNKAVFCVNSNDVQLAEGSVLSDTLVVDGDSIVQTLHAYASCYDASELVVSVDIEGCLTNQHATSVEVVGDGAAADMFRIAGYMQCNKINAAVADADAAYGILAPSGFESVICVGGTACRPKYVNVEGKEVVQPWGASGQYGSYSSVGPALSGVSKPNVMAPGANIISSMSSYYMAANPNDNAALVSTTAFEGRTYGWLAAGGTSMSAPAVAGIIALWLQANPMLTPDDVMAVFKHTCRPCGDYGDATPSYCGYGAIDAYAGLIHILGLSDVKALQNSAQGSFSVAITTNRLLTIRFVKPLEHDAQLNIYSTDGRLCLSECLMQGGDAYYVSLSSLPVGVYAVAVEGREVKGGTLVRLGQ